MFLLLVGAHGFSDVRQRETCRLVVHSSIRCGCSSAVLIYSILAVNWWGGPPWLPYFLALRHVEWNLFFFSQGNLEFLSGKRLPFLIEILGGTSAYYGEYLLLK